MASRVLRIHFFSHAEDLVLSAQKGTPTRVVKNKRAVTHCLAYVSDLGV